MLKTLRATMSAFAQIAQHLNRDEFNALVRKHGHDKGAKGFSSWAQFLSMVFAQIAGCDSLRSIQNAFKSLMGEHNHLGLPPDPVAKSTLACANEKRPAKMFEELFYKTCDRLSRLMRPGSTRRFKFKSPLRLVDSTTIELCLQMYDWALYKTAKGAVKPRLGLDGETRLPGWAFISTGKMADVKALPLLDDSSFLPRGSIVVLDRGYIDYDRFHRWCLSGVDFVTRAKDNMAFDVLESRGLAAPVGRPQATGQDAKPRSRVLADLIIRLSGKSSFEKCPDTLRMVRYWDEDGKREFAFLTSNMSLAAGTIARICKERWAIESFFKCLKQNMVVKSFLGTSFNAVMTQIWISLITLMLMRHLKFLCAEGWALSVFLSIVRLTLMTHVNLLGLIEHLADKGRPPPILAGGPVNRLF
jgi:hypothetical protein